MQAITSKHDHLAATFRNWQSGQKNALVKLEALLDWFHQQPLGRDSAFASSTTRSVSDLRTRLQSLREYLLIHFTCETMIGEQLVNVRGRRTAETRAVQQQTEQDHRLLLSRLDELASTLATSSATFDGWKEIGDQLDLFFDVLEQHEEYEAEHILWLIPPRGYVNLGGRNDVSQY